MPSLNAWKSWLLPVRVTTLTLILFFAVRLVLWLITGSENAPVSAAPSVFLWGFLDDLRAAVFVALPFWLTLAIAPPRLHTHKVGVSLRAVGVFATFFLLTLGAIAEVVFWEEFSTRFNFIAVDYLLYTHEVLANILQSYPVALIFLAIGVSAGLMSLVCIRPPLPVPENKFSRRIQAGIFGAAVLPFCATAFPETGLAESTVYTEELSRNGLVSLTRAAFKNELDYHRFYLTLPRERANRIISELGVRRIPLGEVLKPEGMMDRAGDKTPFRIRPRNVVLITVESLSADYLTAFGNTRGLTPNLDSLARDGVIFTKLLATGTRTVRGLEAVSLGTPPIPGQAIVRRPNIDHLSTLGEIVAHQGVRPIFLYGGDGFFDNMDAYFGSNSYRIVDRKSFRDEEITFENAWGVADEVLYTRALSEIDAETASGKRILAHIMTTSNHRPYTYPEGRIDIPSPGGREGAVKYSDWALGDFIRRARTKPWFKDTLFVIVADHCASAAGKTRLPIYRYRIPMVFYAPDLLSPGSHDLLMSQIDIPPTLLEVMGLRGDDHFFGRSIYEHPHPLERAFVSNYQELGYLRNDTLTVLRPKRGLETYHIDPTSFEAIPTREVRRLRDEAIAYYQTAADAFKEGQLMLPPLGASASVRPSSGAAGEGIH